MLEHCVCVCVHRKRRGQVSGNKLCNRLKGRRGIGGYRKGQQWSGRSERKGKLNTELLWHLNMVLFCCINTLGLNLNQWIEFMLFSSPSGYCILKLFEFTKEKSMPPPAEQNEHNVPVYKELLRKQIDFSHSLWPYALSMFWATRFAR